MLDFLRQLLDSAGFVPRARCGDWSGSLILLHNVSDFLIFFSYMAIPCVLLIFIRKRRDLPFPRLFWMFGAFIVLCGLTHLMDIVMFTIPVYRLSGLVKLATAAVSLATVVALVPLVPAALALRSPKELDEINRRLESEIAVRRRTEEELARKNAELVAKEDFARAVTQAASDAIVSADDEGNIVSWNSGAREIFGHEPEEAIGRSLRLLMPERQQGELQADFQRVATAEVDATKTLEMQGRRKDGREFSMEVRLDGWKRSGRKFCTGVIRDTTERQRRIDEIQKLNRELEAFSYSVSHDLRAPLRAINGFSAILLEEHGPKLDADGNRLLRVVADSAERMGRLIDDLLEFSRTGRAELREVDVDMKELANAVSSQQVEAHRGQRIEARIGELPPASGDRNLLRQVWVNLIDNAVKYSSRRDVASLEIGATSTDTHHEYWVRDHGVGFDMAYVHKLFNVFQRLHSNDEFEGTGVGLALVQRIVHRHGGRVWAEGKPGAGATFHFTLPRRKDGHGDL